MNMKGVLGLSGIVVSGLLLLLLSACTNPATTSSPNTISGIVRDATTGAPINGATVVMGNYSAVTDSTGSYHITLGSGQTSVSGALAVSDGTTYGFRYVQSGTIDASSDPSNVDASLVPAVTPTTVTLSGTITDGSKTTLPSGSLVNMTIVNSNGGSTTTTTPLTYGTNYTVTTATTGSDCFVAVGVTYPSGSTNPFVFYLKNQNITANNSSYNLTVPSTTPTTVTLSGETVATGASFGMAYDVPSLGTVIAYSGDTSSSTISKLDVYDPDNYQVEWGGNVTQNSSAPVIIKDAYSAVQALTSSESIPAFAFTPTTSYDDVTSGSYSGGTLTFATSSDTNVNAHEVLLVPVDSTNAAIGNMKGVLWLQNGSVTLPTSIQTVISDELSANTGSSWGIFAFAAQQSGITANNIFEFIQTAGGSGLLRATNVQFAGAADTNSIMQSGFIN